MPDLEAPSREQLDALADRLRESLLAYGARQERERLVEEIAAMIEAEAAATSHAIVCVVLSDLARRVREMR